MLRLGRTLSLVAGAALIVCAIGTRAFTQGDAAIIKLPPEIVFKAPLEGPPQTVVLFGDPSKPGLFVSRVRFSPGWKDPPHWHPDFAARTAVVLSGTLYFGTGDTWDEANMKAYPSGNVLFRAGEGTALHLGQGRRSHHSNHRHWPIRQDIHQKVG